MGVGGEGGGGRVVEGEEVVVAGTQKKFNKANLLVWSHLSCLKRKNGGTGRDHL